MLVPALVALSGGLVVVPASWVQLAGEWIPMIRRVTAYGHPSPQLLQSFLTVAWLAVPVLVIALRGSHDHFARPVSFGTGLAHAVLRYLVLVTLGLGLLFFVWYWPNFGTRDFLFGPIEVWGDKRSRIFHSTLGLAIGVPFWLLLFAGVVEALRAETAAFRRLWRSGYWR